MATKSQISTALKAIGYKNIKHRISSFSSKTYKNCNGKMVKGIAANAIGPLNVTDAHIDHKNKTEHIIRQTLREIGLTSSDSRFLVSETKKSYTYLVMSFDYFPTYAREANLDPAYKTGYFTFSYVKVDK